MLQTVVKLALQIQRDEQSDERELRHRDRHLGKSFSHLSAKPMRQLVAWLNCVSVEEDRTKALHAARALKMVILVVFVIGSVIGSGVAAAAFHYDGHHPINILPVLAVFVCLPLVILVPFGIAVLPRSWVRQWPFISDLQESLAMMLVGMMSVVVRTLPQPYREAWQQAAGRREAYRRVYGYMQKWVLLTWSQTFALAFMLAALAWFGYRLVVTDLAFTWSTTLQTEQPDTLYARAKWLTDLMSSPWSGVFPQARPSEQLIRETHYFHLKEGVLPDSADPAVLGGWWPFLMMSMVCYGLLPRLLTLLFCVWRYRVASRWSLLNTPGAAEVLDRLNSVMIETQSPTIEAVEVQQSPVYDEAPISEVAAEVVSQATVINWSAVPVDQAWACQRLSQQFALDVQYLWHAGGNHTLEADADVISQVAMAMRDLQEAGRLRSAQVVVLVKVWEPPMMEVVDFLHDLRQAIGDGVRILVVALGMEPHDGTSQAEASMCLDQWRRKLTTVGDPWLKIRSLTLDAYAVPDRGGGPDKDDARETDDD